MSEIYSVAKKSNGVERLIDLKLVYVLMYLSRNEDEKAVTEYIEALEMAADDNLIIHFLFDLDQMGVLLNDVYKRHAAGRTSIPDSFMQKFRQAVEKKKKRIKINPELELSARELTTLKLMTENLTNKEIAERTFVSVNTVKTHLKNIFIKLDVNNRSDAVAKAKKMKLL